MSETGDLSPPQDEIPDAQNQANLNQGGVEAPPELNAQNQGNLADAAGAAGLAQRGAAALPAPAPVALNPQNPFSVNVVPEGTPIPLIAGGPGNGRVPGPPNLFLDVPNTRLLWVGSPPTSDLERYLAEEKYLENVAATAIDVAARNAATAIKVRRDNDPSILAQAIQNLMVKMVGEAQATGFEENPIFFENIEIPPLGTVDVVPSEARKALAAIMGNRRYSGEDDSFEAHGNLELLLDTTATYVTQYQLSGKGVFALLRPFLTRFAAEQLTIYATMGGDQLPVFIDLLQAQSRSTVNRVSRRAEDLPNAAAYPKQGSVGRHPQDYQTK